ncbi:DUF1007 family protein [Roseovarius salinarum]|uniref:DUF1007 family protein n=1 Tax=Roseovarius salinarum TaxID=1981892 RepID=UPI000C32A951|nr:DUF1007 family protein [Roseovarius salinarum]
MRGLLFVICGAWLACASSGARAHPHVFVDVALRFEADPRGRVTGVEVTWSYDAFYSLLVLSDRGLDADGDGALTPGERARLEGFDLVDWPDGFDGGLFITRDGGRVALSAPRATGVQLRDGRLVSSHTRDLGPIAPDGLVIRPYDPSYYAALTLTDVRGLPGGCATDVEAADDTAADAKVADLMGTPTEAGFAEVKVGRFYADTLTVSCAPSS